MKKSVTILFLLLSFLTQSHAQSKGLILIKERIVTELMKNKPNDQQVALILSQFNEDKWKF
jgi:hypothetical protein